MLTKFIPKTNRFTAYKISLDSAQTRRDFVYDLTLQEAREFPLGVQKDAVGPFTWSYGINGGVKI